MSQSHTPQHQAHIIGWSHLPFGKHENKSLEDLVVQATTDAITHAQVDAQEIDAIYIGHAGMGLVPEGFVSGYPALAHDDLRFKPSTRVENACVSGTSALYQGLQAIDAGLAETVLVVGAEKMTSVSGEQVTTSLASASYVADEAANGMTFPKIFAYFAQQYFERYGNHSEALAHIAAKNHLNGTRNPLAQLRRDFGFDFCNTVSDKNPIVAMPLRKTDCSLVSDGAAAIILRRANTHSRTAQAVKFRSTAQVNDFLPMSRRSDVLAFEGPRRAWAQALAKAGISVHDLSLAEVHDCFTIAELLSYEAMGLAAQGRGADVLKSGLVYADGALPVNPSGGLKAKGHPVGATGVSMHVLACMQLNQQAGDFQVPNANLVGVFNMGGSAVVNCVSILEHA